MIAALLLSLSIGPVLQVTAPPSQIDPALIRVHVRTSDGGDAAELGALRESVKQLTAALSSKKKSGLTMVADADSPTDVVIAIEERAVTVPRVVIGLSGGMGAQAGRPGPAPQQVKVIQLRATIGITREADTSEITNKNRANDSESGWKSAAEDLAKQVEKWIAEHRSSILEARRRRS
jgi:hypothetical protein